MKNYLEYAKSSGMTSYTNVPMMPTGFMYLDYNNGKKHVVFDDNEIPVEEVMSVGIVSGSLNIITGKSATGKSTLALHIAQSIIHPFLLESLIETIIEDNMDSLPLIEFYDAEKKFDISMAKRTTQYPSKLLQKIFTVHRKSTDKEITDLIDRHIEYKKKHMKKVKFKFKDIYGNNYVGYPPTVIIVDSVNQIDSHQINSYEDMVGNTTGMLRAKAIQNVYTFMSKVSGEYNITFLCIQHILNDINMGFLPKAKQFRGLKQNEKFVAGEKSILLSTNIFRLEHVKEVGTEKSSMLNLGDGVEGFVTRCTQIKSTTNVMGRSCHLINLNATGYHRLLSNFYEATLRGDVERSGNNYLIKNHDAKISMKKFIEMVEDDFKIAEKLYYQLERKLEPLLSAVDTVKKAEKEAKKLTEAEEEDIISAALFNVEDYED